MSGGRRTAKNEEVYTQGNERLDPCARTLAQGGWWLDLGVSRVERAQPRTICSLIRHYVSVEVSPKRMRMKLKGSGARLKDLHVRWQGRQT